MTKVKMAALDTIHLGGVRAEPFLAGEQFEIDASQAKELEDRGLAKRATKAAK